MDFLVKHFGGVGKYTLDKPYINDDESFIDIFAFGYVKDRNVYTYIEKHHQEVWPNELFYVDEILDNKGKFIIKKEILYLYLPDGNIYDKIEISVPTNVKNYFDRAYPEWQIKYNFSHTHSSFYNLFDKFNLNKNIKYITQNGEKSFAFYFNFCSINTHIEKCQKGVAYSANKG